VPSAVPARLPSVPVILIPVAGISAETLRKIETGRAPTPAFFTVAALAAALGLGLDEVAARCAAVALPEETGPAAAA
jgi:hypothetical protein